MENYRKKLKRKLLLFRIAYIVMLILSIAFQVLMEMGVIRSAVSDYHNPWTPCLFGTAITMIIYAGTTQKALKNEAKLQELYVAQTDERLRLIGQAAFTLSSNIFIVALFLSAMVFAFISETVYYTLMAVIVIWVLIAVLCDAYYRKKY